MPVPTLPPYPLCDLRQATECLLPMGRENSMKHETMYLKGSANMTSTQRGSINANFPSMGRAS